MAVSSKILLKRTSNAGAVPELSSGEPFVNLTDRQFFVGTSGSPMKFSADILKLMTDGVWLDWDMTTEGGTAEQPLYIIYTKGDLTCRLTLTWTSGEVSEILYEFKENQTFVAIGSQTISQNNGRPTITWSNS
jgi:hypothetical protein